MAQTDAKRQAQYRARQRILAAEPIKAAVERERQAIFADRIAQIECDNDPERFKERAWKVAKVKAAWNWMTKRR